jgi:hypothetical protein
MSTQFSCFPSGFLALSCNTLPSDGVQNLVGPEYRKIAQFIKYSFLFYTQFQQTMNKYTRIKLQYYAIDPPD